MKTQKKAPANMKTQDTELMAAIDTLMAKAVADYTNWWGARKDDPTVKKLIEEFRVYVEGGNKYIKVVQESVGGSRSVHCFVVAKDTVKFKRGDILKSATWKAPATNFKRGNVLEGDLACIRWTGAL